MFSGEFKRSAYLDLNYLKENFFENYKKLDSLEGKDLVLLFGSSKSGKSTFANYMAGCQMEHKEVYGDTLIVPKAKQIELLKIGYGQNSETSQPQTIPTSQGFDYCDTPSFDDNRLVDAKICGTILTQLAIQKARLIRGIIFLVPYDCLNNLDSFYHNINAMDQIIKDLHKTGHSILFLITKAPHSAEQKHIQSKISFFADIEEKSGISKRIARTIYRMILDNPSCMSLFRPLDEKQRDIILRQTAELKPIPKFQFKFPKFDADHVKFEELIEEFAEKSSILFKYRNLLKEILSAKLPEKDVIRYTRQLNEIEEDILSQMNEETSDMQFAYKISQFVNFDPTIVGSLIELYREFNEDMNKSKKMQVSQSFDRATYAEKFISILSVGSSSLISYFNQNTKYNKPTKSNETTEITNRNKMI